MTSSNQALLGHLFRLGNFQKFQYGGGNVGQSPSGLESSVEAFLDYAKWHRQSGMGGMRPAGLVIYQHLTVAVVSRYYGTAILFQNCLYYPAGAFIHSLDCFACCRDHPGMPHHITIGIVQNNKVV